MLARYLPLLLFLALTIGCSLLYESGGSARGGDNVRDGCKQNICDQADGTCEAELCRIDCTDTNETCECPAGVDCLFSGNLAEQSSRLQCGSSQYCRVDCSGHWCLELVLECGVDCEVRCDDSECTGANVNCGSGACDVFCDGEYSCRDAAIYGGSGQLQLSCGTDACVDLSARCLESSSCTATCNVQGNPLEDDTCMGASFSCDGSDCDLDCEVASCS